MALGARCYVNIHMQVVHEGKKPFMCELCGYATSYPQSLKKHIQTIHEGKKPVKV